MDPIPTIELEEFNAVTPLPMLELLTTKRYPVCIPLIPVVATPTLIEVFLRKEFVGTNKSNTIPVVATPTIEVVATPTIIPKSPS